MDDYLSKPFKIEDLHERLQGAVRGGAATGTPAPASESEAEPEENQADHLVDPDAPAIDPEKLAELEELVSPELVLEIQESFVESAPGAIAQMRTALTSADADTLARAAHSLKSSSLNVGAVILSQLCKELEQLARAGSLDDCKPLVQQASAEYDRVFAVMQPAPDEAAR